MDKIREELERNCFNCRFFEEINANLGESYCHRKDESHADMWRRGKDSDPYHYFEKCWSGWIKGKIVEANPEWEVKNE